MGTKPIFKYLFSCYIFLGLMSASPGNKINAQEFSVSASPDSTLMFIGGQMDLTLEVSQTRDLKIMFPQFNDTITKNIEIVERTEPDTINVSDNRISVKQIYRITSFDSGLHYIPPMKFEMASSEIEEIKRTGSIGLRVVNPFEEVDPQKGITDIKAPINTPFKISELYRFLPWILGGLAVILLISAAIYFYIKRRNPLDALIKQKPKEPAHVVALRHLDKIKKEKLWQKGQIKQYYSSISDTLRHYIEDRYDIPAPEQITSEIMESLRHIDLPDENVENKVKQVLELSDLVKFAKYEPLQNENDLSLMNAYFFVNQTKYEEQKTLEESAEEMSLNKEENK